MENKYIQYLKFHSISKPSIKRKVKDSVLSKASTMLSHGNKVTIAVSVPLMGMLSSVCRMNIVFCALMNSKNTR